MTMPPSRAAGHDDARHDGRHQSYHGNAHKIGHIDLSPEKCQLNGADKGQDHSHKKADEGDYGKGLPAAGLDDQPQVGGAILGFTSQ
jgi:hypothetical protein